jgi:hypothetical protein
VQLIQRRIQLNFYFTLCLISNAEFRVQTHPRRLEGRYRGGSGGNEWGKEAGPALNPLKGILGLPPPYARLLRTQKANL